MAAYREEPSILNELENAFYRLTEMCWWGLFLTALGCAGVQLVISIVNRAWGTDFDPTLSMPIRAWLAAFILGTGTSLVMENWDPLSGGWSRTLWWAPFAIVLAALWLYLML